MNILVVADFFPWPPLNGGLLRLANTIEGLSELGEIDLFSFVDEREKHRAVPDDVRLARLVTTPHPIIDRSKRWRVAWLTHRGVPMEVVMRQADPSARKLFDDWAGRRYDLVWFRTPKTYAWLGRPRLGPTIVDIDGLTDEGERERAALMGGHADSRPDSVRWRRWLARGQARLNARDWRQFQQSIADEVDRVVLCSQGEVDRSGMANSELVVNTYPRPNKPAGRRPSEGPPIVLFQGTFDYGPNADGADWLVREVAPRLRNAIPDVRIRLVGKPARAVEDLHSPPEVTTVGVVPSMVPELQQADLAAVPIRYGSGTRLKILESFAHRVPVVSTVAGAEGMPVEHGRHLLLADDPDDFADSCRAVLTDRELRDRLVTAAENLYLEHFESAVAKAQIKAIVGSLTGTTFSAR